MDVGVGMAVTQLSQQFSAFSQGDALWGGAEDVASDDRPGHCGRGGWAIGFPTTATEEHDDSPCLGPSAQVDMGNRDTPLQRIREDKVNS